MGMALGIHAKRGGRWWVLAFFAHHPELTRRQFQTAGAWILTAKDPPAIVRLFETAVNALGLSCLGKSGSLPCACK